MGVLAFIFRTRAANAHGDAVAAANTKLAARQVPRGKDKDRTAPGTVVVTAICDDDDAVVAAAMT